ncbi:unnamed protein product [Mytilus edulis]|uniref:Uncharacterized protein n=1 Tax=Mytilus edulis TaxID=6550 RepID=A0A8S3VN08_MYTED|nr:unnamed protein product [Mytilus edulis]
MQRYEEKFNSIDTAMITEISERTSGQIEEKLQGLWKQATKREEEKSATIWLKNKTNGFKTMKPHMPVELLQSRDRSPSYPENDIWDNEEWTQIRGQRKTGKREDAEETQVIEKLKRPEQTTAKPTCSSELNKTTNRIDPKVINLSSTKLDNSQIDLLIKGFKFTPTPTPNTTILKSDIQQFSRRLRLREYFGNGKFDDGSLVRNKSTFTPNTGRDEYLDSFIDTISKLPINYHNTKQNLSRREKKSQEELKNNPSIIFKRSR